VLLPTLRAKDAGSLPNLGSAAVYVAGASASSIPKACEVEKFWPAYFKAAKARLNPQITARHRANSLGGPSQAHAYEQTSSPPQTGAHIRPTSRNTQPSELPPCVWSLPSGADSSQFDPKAFPKRLNSKCHINLNFIRSKRATLAT